MPIAYWCVLFAALLPLFIVAYAKAGSRDNNNPRATIDSLPPPQRRAYSAHMNAYENFPFFAVAVIVAVTQGATMSTVNALALAFVALRIVHVFLYIADQATARSVVYMLGLLVNIAIFVLPAFK